MTTPVQTLKGFRDFLPTEKRKRDYIKNHITKVFEQFGFDPLETPTLEYADLLLGKYGDEADKLVYTFEDRGERKVGLRYDQTVPTARILAQYGHELPTYFRRYQIQNVFRADKPQKGRFREFTQCDIDIFGSTSSLADAEILSCTYAAFKSIGFDDVVLKINDRQILFQTLQPYETDTVHVFSLIQSIDKLDKQTADQIEEELVTKGLTRENAKNALTAIEKAPITDTLSHIIHTAATLGVSEEHIVFTPELARGLDYYTGMIFEVMIPGYTVGSCGGGGRYDTLIEQLGGRSVPAVGAGFGFDRIVEAADEMNLFPSSIMQPATVLVTLIDESTNELAQTIATRFRSHGIHTELWIEPGVKLEKQLKYADTKGIPYVIIIGPDEAKEKKVTLKDLQNRTQTQYTIDEVVNFLNTR